METADCIEVMGPAKMQSWQPPKRWSELEAPKEVVREKALDKSNPGGLREAKGREEQAFKGGRNRGLEKTRNTALRKDRGHTSGRTGCSKDGDF